MPSALPKPICAVCKREVDEMEVEIIDAGRVWMVLVECHGQKERKTTPIPALIGKNQTIEPGVAFETPETQHEVPKFSISPVPFTKRDPS